jgi:hypothetical protein
MTTARPDPKDLIPQSPFTEIDLLTDKAIESAIKDSYEKALSDCFKLVMDENMAEPLKIRLMQKIQNLSNHE